MCIFAKNARLRVLCKCFMDLEFFNRILSVDSTSGKEGGLADMLSAEFAASGRNVELFEVGDGTKLLHGGVHGGLQRAEAGGQGGGGYRTDVADAQGEQESLQSRLLGFFNGINEIFSGLIPHALQIRHLLRRQGVEVGGVADEVGADEGFHDLGAEAVDIHGVLGGEMLDTAGELGGTGGVGTADGGFAFLTEYGLAAGGAYGGHLKWYFGAVPLFGMGADHLGDDVPCFTHRHCIANCQTLFINKILHFFL